MSFAAMSAQVVTPEAYNKLQQDHEQLRAKTAQLVGQFKALKAEKEASASLVELRSFPISPSAAAFPPWSCL